jgi:hypothetical protein
MRTTLFLLMAAASAAGNDALDPASPVWTSAPVMNLALHRTPPLYATDAPAAREIDTVQLQVMGKVVRLEWKDPSQDRADLPAAKNQWQSQTALAHSAATDRFFDACAVMIPIKAVAGGVNPSLQMGDHERPVRIFLYDAARGASVMEAAGRGTTKRIPGSFEARSAWSGGAWKVTMEIPELASGSPVSVAIWNGSQQDRDGRKYFTIWQTIP